MLGVDAKGRGAAGVAQAGRVRAEAQRRRGETVGRCGGRCEGRDERAAVSGRPAI
ncbi:MAG: hypothetical protein AVDCRST_MAG89-1270 [uncultured Gemmatimonadetes bacterium]|uniref:Uncharacterized protein n=1 Tax=uncultured Gemmatimonadota bacterium TaxID=203437 RepID=A0A6J4KRB2_9BACT|nr:MAG: hypothetical protein AVDCRST_MAG89-1270 [uncultured Gemmatimonadota bacterium]